MATHENDENGTDERPVKVSVTESTSNFAVPQDADVTADQTSGDTADVGASEATGDDVTASDAPSSKADEVAEDPSTTADTPSEAEEISPESPDQ
ncbi:hypothetical protein SAMN04489806_2540 [Paramicrobacterium humi]|uniref:Uncharacterized protein n=1 Tax=Paramicrobacterium humi TaxID=640635 RepID=A0A1H4PKN4_9MICO|nr:hypothetical protein [Microbacterium humi]SEC08013.1 hypothetical protein SAMN04489806_2540 [Microbacterium humi]